MILPPPKVCELIRKLHAMLGSPSDKEALTAGYCPILAGSALRGLAGPLTATGLDERRLGP